MPDPDHKSDSDKVKTRTAPKTRKKGRPKQIAVEEWHRTIRFLGVCCTVAVCVWKISDAVVKIMDKPPWLVALTTIIAVLLSGFVQTPVLYGVLTYVRKWTRETLARQSQAEQAIDPERSSSGLTHEGGDPEGIEHGA
jgi:hypothetical protein